MHGNAAQAARKFLNRLDDMGWTPVTDYQSGRKPMTVECPQGHEQDIRPETWRGTCDTCNPLGSLSRNGFRDGSGNVGFGSRPGYKHAAGIHF